MKRLERERGPRTEKVYNKAGARGGRGVSNRSRCLIKKGSKIKSTKEREGADRKGEDKGRSSTLVDCNYGQRHRSSKLFLRRI